MKKISLLLVGVMMLGTLTACGEKKGSTEVTTEVTTAASTEAAEENAEDTTEEAEENAPITEYSYTIDGTTVKLNDNMADVLAKIGEPDKYFESESCGFQGLDKVYTYGSAVITTYPDGDKDFVYTIELKDDTVETDEGLYIGASKDDVKSIYGEPGEETDLAYIYKLNKTMLTVIFGEDDSVEGITYTFIIEAE